MLNAPDVTLILPAYNEVKRINVTIKEVQSYFEQRDLFCEIIVAADGDDGTREAVSGLAQSDTSVRVIGHRDRRGKGRGIREAVKISAGAIIGFADADNKVPIDEFEKIYPFVQNGFDVVIGSRALRDSRVERPQPLYRQIGSKAFALFMHAAVGLRQIRDTQCGFKFFKRDVAKDLFRRQSIDGYMFDVEILSLAERLGYTIKEVPIRWHDDADSRLQLVSGNIRNAVDIFRIRRSVLQGMRKHSFDFLNGESAQSGPTEWRRVE